MYHVHLCAFRSQKRMLDSLELGLPGGYELPDVGYWARSSANAVSAFDLSAISLDPTLF